MHIDLIKVTLHNFLSYSHAEIDLKDRGYCLVQGINNCPKDNASSNGVGKTAFSSAICWALTGETIHGISQNIKNIFIDEKLCYVELIFKVDNVLYKVTRYKEPKSDLKIEIDNMDKSGKGIRESEEILKQYLPDVSVNLLASIIILGQGLPHKFSNNTPSGRKDILETLSKSDFMINDLRERISNRQSKLQEKKRKVEDTVLSIKTKKELLSSQLTTAEQTLIELSKPHDFDAWIAPLEKDIITLQRLISESATKLANLNEELSTLNAKLSTLLEEKNLKLGEENEAFDAFKDEYYKKKLDLQGKITPLSQEIQRLKSITDICPTCGQKLQGVVKPDTSVQEEELKKLKEDLAKIEKIYTDNSLEHSNELKQIAAEYQEKVTILNLSVNELNTKIKQEQQAKTLDEARLTSTKTALAKYKLEKESFLQKIEETKSSIASYESNIKLLDEQLLYNNTENDNLENRLNIISQMQTAIKRDFRGFLLSNIISFINLKVKEYAKEIFNTDELDFCLNGNNIDITYCNKAFESLSGGEKQKVDLIIQFAIRDMMTRYLDFSANILVLDEITDNLDMIGCNSVLNLISDKLTDVESIFIISHRADDLQIPFDNQLKIIKNKKGISYIG